MDSEGSPRTILFKFELKLLKRHAVDLSCRLPRERAWRKGSEKVMPLKVRI